VDGITRRRHASCHGPPKTDVHHGDLFPPPGYVIATDRSTMSYACRFAMRADLVYR